jgi:hypothetical protein
LAARHAGQFGGVGDVRLPDRGEPVGQRGMGGERGIVPGDQLGGPGEQRRQRIGRRRRLRLVGEQIAAAQPDGHGHRRGGAQPGTQHRAPGPAAWVMVAAHRH